MPASKEGVGGLVALALADPTAALANATRMLERSIDDSSRITALRARGLAYRMLGNLDASSEDLVVAMQGAEVIEDSQAWCGAALTMAGTLVYQGRPQDAKDLLHRCIEAAQGLTRTEALFQLGSTHIQLGEHQDALHTYAEALPQIREFGRRDWESHLLGNRGVVYMQLGDFAAALRDFDSAIGLQIEDGSGAQAALNMHNKAQVLYMSGDIGAALDLYEIAEKAQGDLGMPVLMHAQKCDAYLAAGMFEDTLALAQRSQYFNRTSGAPMGEILTLLAGAEAAIALGHGNRAIELANVARTTAIDAHFPLWATRADLVLIEARPPAEWTKNDLATAMRLHETSAHNDSVTSARAILVAARIAVAIEDYDTVDGLLQNAAKAVRRAPLHLHVERWKLVGERRAQVGNRQGLLRAVDAGFRAFERLVSGVGAYDVRARATRHVQLLADAGIRSRVDAGELHAAVTLIERLRDSAVQMGGQGSSSTLRPNPTMTAEAAVRRGEPNASGARLLGLQQAAPAPTPGALLPAISEMVATFADLDGEVLCISSHEESAQLHRCGSVALVAELVDTQNHLRRQLARAARLTSRSRQGLEQHLERVETELSERLLPFEVAQQLRINPSAATRNVVWGAMKQLAAVPHTIAPSTRAAHQTLPVSVRRVALLGSTELDHVSVELTRLSAIYETEPHLDPEHEIHELLKGADLVHVAGHFESKGENPLLAELSLGDDVTLRAVDYLQLTPPPLIAVLSACSTGVTDAVGGVPFGFATAALAAGSSAVVVAQTLLEDGEAIVEVMAALHRHLRAGTPPAFALAEIRKNVPVDYLLAAQSLTVMGTGW